MLRVQGALLALISCGLASASASADEPPGDKVGLKLLRVTGEGSAHSERVTSLAFSPDGKTLLSGSHDKSIAAWNAAPLDAEEGRLERIARAEGAHVEDDELSGVSSVAFSPDGKAVISTGVDRSIALRDAVTLQLLKKRDNAHDYRPDGSGKVTSIHISPNGKHIVSAGSQDLKIWDAATLKPRAERLGAHKLSFGMSCPAAQFSPDGSMIASAGKDGSIKVWRAGSCEPQDESCSARWLSLELVAEKQQAHSDTVRSIHFSADSKRIVSGSDDKSIAVWDAATLQLIAKKPAAHKDMIWSARFSPDGTMIVTGGWDKAVKIWSSALEVIAEEPNAHGGPVLSAVFSPDGATIASAGAGCDKLWGSAYIKVWDAGAFAGAPACVAAAATDEAAKAENQTKTGGSETPKLKAEDSEKAKVDEKEEL